MYLGRVKVTVCTTLFSLPSGFSTIIVLVTVLVSVVSIAGFLLYFTVTVLSAVAGVTDSSGTSFEV